MSRGNKRLTVQGFPQSFPSRSTFGRDSGYSPTTYDGQDSGFELYLEPAAAYLESFPDIAKHVGARDTCVSFRSGGDVVEAAAAIACGAALTKLTDGIYFDPETDQVFSADTVLEGVQEDLAGLA